MLSTAAKIVGFVFLIVGILGFVPAAAPDGHLFGLFHVDTVHNFVHILSGIVGLIVGFRSDHASKMYLLTFGIVYGLVSVVGFVMGDRPIFGIMANNIADAWLHLVLAAMLIGLGLMPETGRATDRTIRPQHT